MSRKEVPRAAARWNPARTALGEHIEVLVNDAVLGVTYDLDTELKGGERITLRLRHNPHNPRFQFREV